jgi:HK97 family phage portal protein
MGLFGKPKPRTYMAQRSGWPIISVDTYHSYFGATPETSLQNVAVQASIDCLASLCSELPVGVFRGKESERTEIPASQHPWLFDPSGDGRGNEDFAYQVLVSWLMRGNMYVEPLVISPRGDFPIAYDIKSPDKVTPRVKDGVVSWVLNGEREFESGRKVGQLSHWRINPRPGQLLGMGVIENHINTVIKQGVTAARFGAKFFEDGGHPTAMLRNTIVSLDDNQTKAIKAKFLAALRGGSREPVVVGKGWEYEPLSVNPEESQFLETQGYTSAECARLFGPGMPEILGYETKSSLTYSTLESRMTHLLVLTANRWFRRLERVYTTMLPRGQYALLDRNAVLQTTVMERFKTHAIALASEFKTINEVRDAENLPPVEWGNEPRDKSGPQQVMNVGNQDDDGE